MTTPTPINPPRNSQRQRGAAILIMTLILMLGLITLFTFRMDRKAPELEADRKTAMALAQAKEALLGRAASDNDPGTLSCPNINLSGIANSAGAAGCSVAAAPSIIPPNAGRLPWKTLESGGVYDGAGERLWYVISPNFIDKGKAVIPATPGTISVNGGPNVAAVIIASGSALSGQNRSAGNDTIMANYLESYVDGARINTTLTPGNDRVITINAVELFNMVTQRMAREFALEMSAEYAANSTYPNTGWLPTSANWNTGHFQNWNIAGVTDFTRISPIQGTLKFPPCVGEFTIQVVAGNDAAVTGKVAC